MTIVLIAAGVLISYAALRGLPGAAPARRPCQRPCQRTDRRPALRLGRRTGPRPVPNWRAAGHSPRLTRLAALACQPGPGRALSIHQVAPAAT